MIYIYTDPKTGCRNMKIFTQPCGCIAIRKEIGSINYVKPVFSMHLKDKGAACNVNSQTAEAIVPVSCQPQVRYLHCGYFWKNTKGGAVRKTPGPFESQERFGTPDHGNQDADIYTLVRNTHELSCNKNPQPFICMVRKKM
jgi:hypothetical protein